MQNNLQMAYVRVYIVLCNFNLVLNLPSKKKNLVLNLFAASIYYINKGVLKQTNTFIESLETLNINLKRE